MNKHSVLIMLMISLLLAGCGVNTASAPPKPKVPPGVTPVEIVYLNHSPVRSVLTKIDKLLEDYGEKIYITRYDINTPEGEEFAKSHNLSGHIPLAIFVNGSMDVTVGGRAVKFYSFPQGQGPGVVPDGAWTIDDFKQVLDQAVVKN